MSQCTSVNIGQSGAFLNLGIPGSGLSYRGKIGGDTPSLPNYPQTPAQYTPQPLGNVHPYLGRPLLPGEGEIKSREISELTSDGLSKLKELINTAEHRKITTQIELEKADSAINRAESSLSLAKTFIFRLVLRNTIPDRQKKVDEKKNERNLKNIELEGCNIDLDFAIDEPSSEAWDSLVSSFKNLRVCSSIWDVTSSFNTNQFAERTTAYHSIDRIPVRLFVTNSELISTKWLSLRFGNANGHDIYLYPGFAMMRDHYDDFALIGINELEIECSSTMFLEEETIPADAKIVGETWKKSNKDGSPDRRFANNYRIPIAQYGKISIRSKTGMHEQYMFSNLTAAEQFYQAFQEYRIVLQKLSENCHISKPINFISNPNDITGNDAADHGTRTQTVATKPSLIAMIPDLVTVMLIIAGLGYAIIHLKKMQTATAATQQQTPAALSAKSTFSPVVPLEMATPPKLPIMTIQVKIANIRYEPSKTGAVVGTLNAGMKVTVFETKGEWMKVGERDPKGWVHQSLLAE
jgi:hypothetical protein